MSKVSWSVWMKKQVKRDDSVGDLAKDMAADPNKPRGNNFARWEKYIQEKNSSKECMTAFYNAFSEYKISQLI